MEILNESLVDIEKRWKGKDVYYTFTGLEKVGINPNSKFKETPNAIYAYSMKDILPTETPFQSDGHSKTLPGKSLNRIGDGYVYVFELKNVRHLDFQKYKEIDYNKDLEILNISKELAKEKLVDSNYFSNSFSERIYRLTQILSNENHNIWNKILRVTLKYEYLIDHGHGLIHEAEPSQLAILSTSPIIILDKDYFRFEEVDEIDPRAERTKMSLFFNGDEKFFSFKWSNDFIDRIIKQKIYKHRNYKMFFKFEDLDEVKYNNLKSFYSTIFNNFKNMIRGSDEIVKVYISLFEKYGDGCLQFEDEEWYNEDFIQVLFNNSKLIEDGKDLYTFIFDKLSISQIKSYLETLNDDDELENIKYLHLISKEFSKKVVDSLMLMNKEGVVVFDYFYVYKNLFQFLSPKDSWIIIRDRFKIYKKDGELEKIVRLLKDQLTSIETKKDDVYKEVIDIISLKESYIFINSIL